MEIVSTFIQEIKSEYHTSEMPFMAQQLVRTTKSKPYQGLTVLQNIPFTRETIVKLEGLLAGGATVTSTSPGFMEVDPELLERYLHSGGCFIDQKDLGDSSYDVHLDCAGELIGRPAPRIGTVEITGTGTNKYKSASLDYPAISIDMCVIKNLEGILGTGEAFVRSFKELTNQNIIGKKFMVFGYGKVGRGMAHYLKAEKADVTVVDTNTAFLHQAQRSGFNTISAESSASINKAATQMFCIATATGRENVISARYDPTAFKGRYLANMGGDDEFGPAFSAEDVMCQKRPINFFVAKPTLMRYLDPVFYAHNMGIDLLLYAKPENGLHAFPSFIAEEVVESWKKLFKETVDL